MKSHSSNYQNAEVIIPQNMIDQVIDSVNSVNEQISSHTASKINKAIIDQLHLLGWSEKVRLDSNSNITITSICNKIGLCVQTGNVGRIYADLIKLQTLYARDSINAGIIILADNNAAKKLGQNIANRERLERELLIFTDVINIPLLIIGFSD